jgi:hypothetical protein
MVWCILHVAYVYVETKKLIYAMCIMAANDMWMIFKRS